MVKAGEYKFNKADNARWSARARWSKTAEGRAWTKRWRAVRSIGALKRNDPGQAGTRAVERLSVEALVFAAQNPDHSEAGRALAREALVGRVGGEEADRRIRDFFAALAPPGFIHADDFADGRDPFFEGWSKTLRQAARVSITLVLLAVALIWSSKLADERSFRRALAAQAITASEHQAALQDPSNPFESDPSAATLLRQRPDVAIHFTWLNSTLRNAANAVFIILILVLVLRVMAQSLHPNPARLLLLRRFNDRSVDRALSRFSRRELSPGGTVFTLADRHFKRGAVPVLLSWSMLFFPQVLLVRVILAPLRLLNRAGGGPVRIWATRDFAQFTLRLSRIYAFNSEAEQTSRKAIMVRTSDAWWQHVVLLLVHSCDAIVVDVTEVAAGTVWELETLLREQAQDAVVFVSRIEEVAEARAKLAAHGFAGAALHPYDQHGKPADEAAFRAAIRAAILNQLGQRNKIAENELRA